MRHVALHAAIGLLVPVSVLASNLVENADFDTDLSSWVIGGEGGTSVWYGADGSPTAGSARLTAGYGDLAYLTQCVLLPSTLASSIDFSADVYMFGDTMNNGTGTGTGYVLFVQSFAGTSCSDEVSYVTNEMNLPVPSAWTRVSHNFFPLPAGYQSALINIEVGGSSFNYTDFAFDHFYMNQVTDRIFGSDFEDPNPYVTE
jgi:hypothetical protein